MKNSRIPESGFTLHGATKSCNMVPTVAIIVIVVQHFKLLLLVYFLVFVS